MTNFKRIFPKFDILINNAGAFFVDYSEKEGTIENTFMTNHVGVVYLTALLINSLNREGRIINVSSRGHIAIKQNTLDEMTSESSLPTADLSKRYKMWTAYSFSKLGNIFHMQKMEEYFRRQNMQVKAVSVHPGLVKTDIGRAETFFDENLCLHIPIFFRYF